jgi:hypothetical protein
MSEVLLGFVDVTSIFWIILFASALHVVEEYFGGFVEMMRKFSPLRGMTKSIFLVVNFVFLILCLLAAIINVQVPIYSLSIAALIFINSFIHIGGAIRVRGYAAGVISAVLFYLPLSICAYVLYSQAGLLEPIVLVSSIVLGGGWMALAIGFGGLFTRRKTPAEKRSWRKKMS